MVVVVWGTPGTQSAVSLEAQTGRILGTEKVNGEEEEEKSGGEKQGAPL